MPDCAALPRLLFAPSWEVLLQTVAEFSIASAFLFSGFLFPGHPHLLVTLAVSVMLPVFFLMLALFLVAVLAMFLVLPRYWWLLWQKAGFL